MANEFPITVLRAYKVRLLPRKGQHKRLQAALDHTRELYNAALEERIGAYRLRGETRTYMTQCKSLTELRADPSYREFSLSLQRWAIKRVDLAYQAFFRRAKIEGAKVGFPRFKGHEWFKSFGFSDADGWKVEGSRLYMMGIGRVRLHLHQALPSKPVACRVKRDSKGWTVSLICKVDAQPAPETGRMIGVDLGITSFIATSDGHITSGFRIGRRCAAQMRRRNRAILRCKRGSQGRKKARHQATRLHEKMARSRRTFLHQVAAWLIRENDLIAIEDLNVKGLARSMLARDVHDAAWGTFAELLAEKAEKAARTLVKVDPRHTSQICPSCGTIKPKTLKERVHRCDCGLTIDRDVAAAQVILMRAVAGPLLHNVGGYAERAA